LRASADEVTFTGGEPLLDERLPSAVQEARALGFRAIGIQTNARRLAGLAQTLARAGLTDVHVSLHGAEPAAHDYHTGVVGSAAEAWAGVAAARAAGLTVVATTVLTRSSFRTLASLPPRLQAAGVAAWVVSLPHAAGRAAAAFDRVMPRLGLALPYALHAVSGARRIGLPAWLSGAPLCALGPLAELRLDGEPRAYGRACEGCAAREACPGVDAAYLARFGGDELRAVAAPAAVAEHALARLFVGAGERAAPPAPSVKLRSLPLLGKVQPGRAEVSAAAPKRSGEDLRILFPGLFEAGKE
jgi:hypothetical protein